MTPTILAYPIETALRFLPGKTMANGVAENWHSCAVLREGDEVKMWAYGSSFDENHNPVRHLGIATARVSDLLEIVEKAKKEGLLENFDRTPNRCGYV